jgi:hypothetical protein
MSTSRRVLLGVAASALLVPLWAQDCTLCAIGTDESKTASLASGDCRLRDLIPGSSANNYAHPYGVTLERDGILTIDLQSTTVDAYLYVYSLGYTPLYANDNLSSQTTDSRVVVALRRGTYILIASTRGVTTGAYTIRTSLGTQAACSEKEALLDSRFDRLAYADAQGDPEIELVMSLEPGSYALLATTSAIGATGAFTLTMTLAEPRSCPSIEMGPGETVKDRLLYDKDCRYLDFQPPSWDTTPLKLYRVVIGKRGVFALSLSSTEFTPFLGLFDEKGIEINSTAYDQQPGPPATV